MSTLPQRPGVWISPAQLAQLPTTGPAWDNLKRDADTFRASPSITIVDQDDKADSYAMAAALVWATTQDPAYLQAVEHGLIDCIGTEGDAYPGENNSSLELARNLCALAIAADVIDWSDAALEARFKDWLRAMLTFKRADGRSIVSTHEERPNNWGTHAGASRVAIAAYLGDTAEIARCAQVFKGWLGDRSAYAGFKYGDLSWQADEKAPVGINPLGAIKNGINIGGVLPEEQRRCGTFPDDFGCQSNYAWEAMQGVVVQAVILRRRGYDAWRWGTFAIGRAAWWLSRDNAQPPTASVNGSDDRWQSYVLNRVFPILALPEQGPAVPGKHVGYTDWLTSAGRWP